ncbi:LLM class F420-dependent oxidoreductase [Arsenicicoccus piscis]|uniref:LLM class F420-dependent oxidoreductase n=1 Tax=Arsenicicoccus piscis TaxID=673954 RepID=A0ABQ6HPS4_9MICO|nr:LLM class F420-dependent oxidoreductase [Arsenicicoccus piscis]MCH8629101.1 LLM class F420-dependent oxidoreductase [Arsenicicoccus piscis]GMA20341.1 LLM class F420-dependent oxidoreductase [Arsenicicoccus piscis]
MRFGLFIPQGWRMDLVGIDPSLHWGVMAGLARRADADHQNWESIWVYDHFHTVPIPSHEATHEAWSLMSAFAAVTGRVRLGQMCTCMSYRNPAYLAKVAATVDIISEGRVEMGIGAGWYEHEWLAYGYGFPRAGERIARLAEGVEIFRQMWTRGEATLDGKHYQVDGAICAPRPLQGTTIDGSPRNGIPMWVAGGGEQKTLRIAAEYADYTNFDGTPEGFVHKSEVLRGHCADLGRDFDEIVRSANYNVVIGRNQREVDDRLAWYEDQLVRAGVDADRARGQREDLARQPLVGTPDQIAETLTRLEQDGMTYAITYFAEAAYDTSGLELFEREVIGSLHRHGRR